MDSYACKRGFSLEKGWTGCSRGKKLSKEAFSMHISISLISWGALDWELYHRVVLLTSSFPLHGPLCVTEWRILCRTTNHYIRHTNSRGELGALTLAVWTELQQHALQKACCHLCGTGHLGTSVCLQGLGTLRTEPSSSYPGGTYS
jgi:hypothetical protein